MSSNKSWRHHSFPYGLQKYWEADGNIQWLDRQGKPISKKSGKRATGWLPHGHATLLDDLWGEGDDFIKGTNFEVDFEYIDNKLNSIVDRLLSMQPSGYSLSDLGVITAALLSKQRRKLDIGQRHILPEELHRDLLELLFSIVNRSLFYRRSMESYSWFDDLEVRRDVGATNIRTEFSRDKSIAQQGPLNNHHFLALYDPNARFVFPDGLPNWIVMRSNDLRLWGRLLVPLTPKLMIYFSTPESVQSDRRVTCLTVPKNLQVSLNKLLMLFSEEKTYFQSVAPKERPDLALEETWTIDPNFEPTIALLDRITGYDEPCTINGLRKLLGQHFKSIGKAAEGGGEVTIPHGFNKPNEL